MFRLFEGNCNKVGDDDDNQRKGSQIVNNLIVVSKSIEVYPNPSNHTFNINLMEASIEQASLKVYDVNGRWVLEKELNTDEKRL